MFAGLASPSHLLIVLVVVSLLFGAKRIPELAKGLGTGVRELREGFSTGEDATEAGGSENEKVRGEKPHDGSEDGTAQTVGAHARQRGL
jgi:sec-independent protein translocase protein TatA